VYAQVSKENSINPCEGRNIVKDTKIVAREGKRIAWDEV
jgi:hypothetical protein